MIEYLRERGLASETAAALQELRVLRNKVAHLGEEADFAGTRAHAILKLDIDAKITPEVARRAIDIAWLIFQQSNSGTLLTD